jgi:hypothetical protein
MMSGPLVNGSSQIAAPFHFPFIVLLHGRGAIFNLQPSSSSPPSTSILLTNFIPFQLQSSFPTSSSSPTSTLVAANFNPRRRQLQPPSLCYFLPFSLMPAMCLMLLLLLPNELLAKIIIHSIKNLAVFHFSEPSQ